MKILLNFFGACFCFLLQGPLLAQDGSANNLHYQFTETSYNRKNELVVKKHEYNFNLQQGRMLAEKLNEGKPFRPYIFDKQSGAVIMTKIYRDDYMVEEIDSLLQFSQKLVATGQAKVISGFNCNSFTVDTLGGKRTIWVTTDISLDSYFDPYVLWLLTKGAVSCKFNGVIVMIEEVFTYGTKTWNFEIVLDKSQLTKNQQPTLWPWDEEVKGQALLPEHTNSYNNNATSTHRKGEQNAAVQYKRMKEFLIKTTGQAKPASRLERLVYDACYWY